MRKPSTTRIPLEENERCVMLLKRLRQGPASTLDLQKELPLVHVARQVWELRHWYGFKVKTTRLDNNIALYTLMPSVIAIDPNADADHPGPFPGNHAVYVNPRRADAPARQGGWQCVYCSATSPVEPPLATLDPKYRRGRCGSCQKNTQHLRLLT